MLSLTIRDKAVQDPRDMTAVFPDKSSRFRGAVFKMFKNFI